MQVQPSNIWLKEMNGESPRKILTAMSMTGKLDIETCTARFKHRTRLMCQKNGNIMLRSVSHGLCRRRIMRGIDTAAPKIGHAAKKNLSFARLYESMLIVERFHAKFFQLARPPLHAGIVFMVPGTEPDTMRSREAAEGTDRTVECRNRTVNDIAGMHDHVSTE